MKVYTFFLSALLLTLTALPSSFVAEGFSTNDDVGFAGVVDGSDASTDSWRDPVDQ